MKVGSILADPLYETLKQYVLERTALHYYDEKDEDLAARIGRRMAAREVQGCAAYLQLLRNDVGNESEWDLLVGEITIGETYFFRQSEHFELLRTTIIPDIMRRNSTTRTLRIWSAGCATGAEPYSISLVLQRHFADQLQGWAVNIIATDINVQFLAQARTGRFGEWALRHLPDEVRHCCFRRSGPMWELLPEYRRMVHFQFQNLAADNPYPGMDGAPVDLIMCRNVMIYFSEERIRSLAHRFYESLAPGGWLLVGHAEPSTVNFTQFEVFTTSETTAYRKRPGERPNPPQQPDFNAWPFLPEAASEARKPNSARGPAASVIAPLPAAPRPGPAARESRVEAARAYADQGEWEKAGELCRQLIAETPLDAAAHFISGLVAEHTGNSADAERSFRKTIYLDRQFALAHYHLGLTLVKNANRAQARKAFANTVDLLRSYESDQPLPHGDGIRAGELRELAEMHLEMKG